MKDAGVEKLSMSEIVFMELSVVRKYLLASFMVISLVHSCSVCPVADFTAVHRYFDVTHSFSA